MTAIDQTGFVIFERKVALGGPKSIGIKPQVFRPLPEEVPDDEIGAQVSRVGGDDDQRQVPVAISSRPQALTTSGSGWSSCASVKVVVHETRRASAPARIISGSEG